MYLSANQNDMEHKISNILIGGASHVGKSTLSFQLGEQLGWEVLSTDNMARHPGRPWPDVLPHVAEFYTELSDESIFTFLLLHYENMCPRIENLLQHRLRTKNYCILEGSALRPEYLARLPKSENTCYCLFAPPDFLRKRIYNTCNYADLDPSHRSLVDVFLERSVRDNEAILKSAQHYAIECLDVSNHALIARVKAKLLEVAKPNILPT